MIETPAAFARRLGVHKSTVCRAIKAGRLIVSSGMLDVADSLQRWEKTKPGTRPDVLARHAAKRSAGIPTQPGAQNAPQIAAQTVSRNASQHDALPAGRKDELDAHIEDENDPAASPADAGQASDGPGLAHYAQALLAAQNAMARLAIQMRSHRRYRMDRKFTALLRHTRRRIDREIEHDFPNLPPGCSIQFERVAREHVLENIRNSLGNLRSFVPETIRTFESETKLPLTFGNFIRETDLSPVELLKNRTWSEWKDLAKGTRTVVDPDLIETRTALRRFTLRTDPQFLAKVHRVTSSRVAEEPIGYGLSNPEAASLHYLFWSQNGANMNVGSFRESFDRWRANQSSSADLAEILDWRLSSQSFATSSLNLPFSCSLRLHAAYGLREISAAFGKATLETTGPAGTGVIPVKENRIYIHLVTFRKEERDFSPTTRYKDYPISPNILHWESQAGTTRASAIGQNYIHFQERGYTILFFARLEKTIAGETAPFLFLGPAKTLVSYEQDRPIKMVWELEHTMPAELYEAARSV